MLVVAASMLALVAMAAACRWIANTSKLLAIIVATGILLRLAVGASIIVVPYFKTPAAERTTLEAVWNIAPDARGYFTTAAQAAEEGLRSIPEKTPSIMYVRMLTLWLMVFGTGPFSPLLMNIACYVLTSVLVVNTLRRVPDRLRLPATGAALLAFTASPMLVYVSTQPLKDPLFILLAVMVAVGAWGLAASIRSSATLPWRRVVIAVAAIVVAVYFIAGVRIYYSLIVCGCLALLFGVSVLLQHRMRASVALATGVVTLLAGTTAFLLGSEGKGEELARSLVNSDGPRTQIDSAREAFIVSGGSTNIAADEKPALDAAREAAVADAIEQAERTGMITLAPPPEPVPVDATSGQDDTTTRAEPTTGPPLVHTGPPREFTVRTEEQEDPGDPPKLLIWIAPANDKAWLRYAREAALGLGTIFVPMTVLKSLSLVDVGGGMQVALADLDTVFLDATLAVMLGLLLWWRRTETIVWTYVVFTLALGILLALLMGYVVTNFGTMVRLRLMLTVPFWTLPFAFRHLDTDDAVGRDGAAA